MLKTFSFMYAIHDVIPPHCRKPRTIFDNPGEVTVEIREVPESDFPLALSRIDYDSTEDEMLTYYYAYDGHLWTELNGNDLDHFNRYNPAASTYGNLTLEEATRSAQTWASQYVLVNGAVYETEYEPCYRVTRYAGKVFIGYEGYGLHNALTRGYFPVNRLEDAMQCALSLPNKDKTIIKQAHFTIFMPKALTVLKRPEVEAERAKQIGLQRDFIEQRRQEIAEYEAEIARLEKAGRYE